MSMHPMQEVVPNEAECARPTFFAPAGRDSPEEIQRAQAKIRSTPYLQQALDAMPNMVAILNAKRQIVAVNTAFVTSLDTSLEQVVEQRPGEALGCIWVKDGPDGCGTARHCATCGMVQGLLESQYLEDTVVRECRLLVQTPNGTSPLDLKATLKPFPLDKEPFILAAIEDISQHKRLAVLQRTFFHDVINTVGCIQGYVSFLQDEQSLHKDVVDRMASLSEQLVEEIRSQQDVLHAESGDLQVRPVPLRPNRVLTRLVSQYAKHRVASGRRLLLGEICDSTVVSDSVLLSRVLGNMVKNALEATSPGQTVTVACRDSGNEVTFAVSNPNVMPPDVQRQIFQRSFSTKGEEGRGIGTYSMKLFGERYLGGTIGFVSQAPEGTTFYLTLPKFPAPSRTNAEQHSDGDNIAASHLANVQATAAPHRSRHWTRFQPDVSEVWLIVNDLPRLACVIDESFGGIGLVLDEVDAGNVQPGTEVTVLHYGQPTHGLVKWVAPQPEKEQVRLGIQWCGR